MRTPARIAKHPIHPMLVPIPIGLWVFSLVCDLVYRLDGASDVWATMAHYTMIGGIVGALLAALPGFVDVFSLPPSVKRIGFAHMGLNLTIVVLYAINAWQRRDGVTDGLVWLSVLSIALLLVSGWLGGEMVYARGVAVDPGADTSSRHFGRVYGGPERRRTASGFAYGGTERRVALQ